MERHAEKTLRVHSFALKNAYRRRRTIFFSKRVVVVVVVVVVREQ